MGDILNYMARLSRQHVLPGLIAVLTLAFIASLWPSFSGITGPAISVGDEAPAFALASDTGKSIQLQDFRGRFVVLNFWATWCPPCIDELPSLNRFQQAFAARGVVVLGVSVDEDAAAYRRFLERVGVGFLTVRDPQRKVSHTYGTYKYPESYFVDREGKVVQKIIGKADWTDPQMLDYMEQLLRS